MRIKDFFSRKKTIEQQIKDDERKVAEVCDSEAENRVIFDNAVFDADVFDTTQESKPIKNKIKPNVKYVKTRSEKWNESNYTFWGTQQVTLKEAYFLNFLKERKSDWVSPTYVGYSYGMAVKNRNDYNAGHARHCLLRLVKFNLVQKNANGHYKIK